ncbi:putative RND family efflux transporter MFP subunit [Magnetofaba australis IT-1]|uniref:Putative RND family efflux transporter MFP subunit n=1 Tax=Magnetofaba australis IT-1 TaxID=1434232 RepID=A0A1Y2K0S4_9PROT|nr:putative RND family efflux transporter MFP subunit [Magnetofaba australis IT-1]
MAKTQPAAVAVTTQAISELIEPPTYRAPAQAVALRRANLTAQVAGAVAQTLVEVGDAVKQGQPLAQLDDWEIQLQARQAEAAVAVLRAQLQLADQQLARAKQLKAKGQASAELLDQRVSERRVTAARIDEGLAALRSARERLRKMTLRAPFDGVITARMAQAGAWAAPGEPQFELVDPTALELTAELESGRLALLRSGRALRFESGGQTYAVTLRAVTPLQDAATRAQSVRLRFDGAAPVAGASGVLTWEADAPHLPARLLTRRDGTLGVFLQSGEQARFHALPQAEEGRMARIPDALLNEHVIIRGREALHDGAAITLSNDS